MDTKNLGDTLDFLIFKCTGREKESIEISSEQKVDIDKYFLIFDSWKGAPVEKSYGKATKIVDYNGVPLFGELAVLRIFQEEGFNGVWVDSFSGLTFRKDMLDKPPVQIPEKQFNEYNKIASLTNSSGGCWDVMVWKDDQTFFIEVKTGKDKIRTTQVKWLEVALNLGYTEKSFISIEWKFKNTKTIFHDNV